MCVFRANDISPLFCFVCVFCFASKCYYLLSVGTTCKNNELTRPNLKKYLGIAKNAHWHRPMGVFWHGHNPVDLQQNPKRPLAKTALILQLVHWI